MSEDLIDRLMAEQLQQPERKQRPRKGATKAIADAKKASGITPAAMEEATMAWTMAKAIVEGKSPADIANDYGYTREAVRKILARAMAELLEDTSNLMLNWATITLNRTEKMLEALMKRMFDDNGVENPVAIELVRSVYKDQMEVIKFLMPKDNNGRSEWDKISSLTAGGDLYNEANMALNDKYQKGEIGREASIADLDGIILDGVATPKRNTSPR